MGWKKGDYKPQITKKSRRAPLNTSVVVDDVMERQRKVQVQKEKEEKKEKGGKEK